jgi:octaprenyl-diphosphate synthase
MLLAPKSDEGVHNRLLEELAAVERMFADELRSEVSCVNALTAHLERYRGKMLRPTLVLATAMAASDGEPLRPAQRVFATVVEMVHMATLVHDDVLDEAQTRRSGATLNRLHGNETAVMLGDHLISHAYRLCSTLEQQEVALAVADTTNTVCEGELLQLANRGNWDLAEQTYFDVIERKTASLCGLCCRLGARLQGAPEATSDALERYGRRVGVAFQIVDDVLDLTGDEATVGKTLGQDLRKGKLTLPLIRALGTAPERAAQELREMLGAVADRALGDAEVARVGQLLQESGVVAAAHAEAEALVGRAKAELAVLGEGQARAMLQEMADAVLTREL